MKILISVILYNEEANLESTLRDLIDHNFGYDIIVIDNGSNDRSRTICDRMKVRVVRHCVNTGGSIGTLLSYFAYAYAQHYDILCQFDGDGQHIAAELPKIVEPVRRGDADCVIGSRFLQKEGFQSTLFRRLGIWFFSRLCTVITKRRLTDITSGFRAYSSSAIEFFGHTYRDPFYDSTNQFLLLATFAGLRIQEVPVMMQERQFGTSEFGLQNSIAYPLKGIMTVIGCLLQRRRIMATRASRQVPQPKVPVRPERVAIS